MIGGQVGDGRRPAQALNVDVWQRELTGVGKQRPTCKSSSSVGFALSCLAALAAASKLAEGIAKIGSAVVDGLRLLLIWLRHGVVCVLWCAGGKKKWNQETDVTLWVNCPSLVGWASEGDFGLPANDAGFSVNYVCDYVCCA